MIKVEYNSHKIRVDREKNKSMIIQEHMEIIIFTCLQLC